MKTYLLTEEQMIAIHQTCHIIDDILSNDDIDVPIHVKLMKASFRLWSVTLNKAGEIKNENIPTE